MSYELNIISVGQEKVTQFREDINIKILNEMEDEPRYFEIWPYMCQTKGIWYTLGAIYRGFFTALPICESNYDIDQEYLPIPYWINDESVRAELTPLIIKEQYINEFKEIIETLIYESPEKTIMFHSRYQCKDYEIIQGVLTLENFWHQLNSQKILFNTCYIIRN